MKTITMREGDDFYIKDTRVLVSQVVNSKQFSLTVGTELSRQAFPMSTEEWVPFPHGVHIQAGNSQGKTSRIVKVRIDAPKDVPILRGDRYRALQSN